MRIHIPLITNRHVEFCSWDLRGHESKVHMAEGEMWYLDTRKPHSAVNKGSSERIHLVVDVEANKDLISLFIRKKEDK